jgi:O-antigen ligase
VPAASLIVRAILMAVAAAFSAGALVSAFIPWPVKAVMVVLSTLAWRRPTDALAMVAALVPIAALAGPRIGLNGQAAYALVLPVLAALTARSLWWSTPLWPHPAVPVLVAVVVASLGVELSAESARHPGWHAELLAWWSGGFLHPNPASEVLDTALLWLTGITLYGVTWWEASRSPGGRASILWAIAVSGAAAALLNLTRLADLSARAPDSWIFFQQALLGLRVDLVFGDLNAAGSFFTLTLFCALALPRSPAWLRAAGITMAALSFGALWVTGSKAALGVTVAVTVVAGLRAASRRRSMAVRAGYAAVVIAIVVVTAVAVRALPDRLGQAGVRAMEFRAAFLQTSAAMIGHAPVFGMGIGRYFEEFPSYAPPWLQQEYQHEHAHNNFLQSAAELGVLGVVAWLWVVFAALAQRLGPDPPTGRPRGLTAGLVAFLLTCLFGHPLLIAPVALSFWIALALAATWSLPPTVDRRHPRGSVAQIVTVAAVVALAASIPVRAGWRTAELDLTHAAGGVSGWSPGNAPPRSRTVGRHARFYVPGDAAGVEFDLRRDDGQTAAVVVDVRFDGRPFTRLTLDDGTWHPVQIVLPERRRRFYRVELIVSGPDVPGHDPAVDAGLKMTWIRVLRRPGG